MINQSNQQADKQQHADGEEVHLGAQTCAHKHTVKHTNQFFQGFWGKRKHLVQCDVIYIYCMYSMLIYQIVLNPGDIKITAL